MPEFNYFSDQTLADLNISMTEVVTCIEETVRDVINAEAYSAAKAGVSASDGRYMMATLSSSDRAGITAIKSVVSNDNNRENGLPSVNGAIMLLDSSTGELLAIMDAAWVTAVRTAGMSLAAARRLANPDSTTVGLIGAGVQARSHLTGCCELFPIEKVYLAGRGKVGVQRIEMLADELSIEFEQASPKTCVEQSSIVISTVTRDFSITPFLDAGWLKPGACALMPDLAIPWHSAGLQSISRVYTDDVAFERSQDRPVVAPALLDGDLFDLVSQAVHYDASISSAFVFRGIAAGDLAVAVLAYQRVTQ